MHHCPDCYTDCECDCHGDALRDPSPDPRFGIGNPDSDPYAEPDPAA